MLRRKIQIIFSSVILAYSVLSAAPALAADTTFSQKILPLDCIFTTVNAGTGELYYVTPEACGVFIPPSSTTTTSPTAQPGNVYSSSYSPNRPVFYVPSTASDGNPTNANFLPWRPVVSTAPGIGKLSKANTKVSSRTIKVVIGGIVVLIALIVFIL